MEARTDLFNHFYGLGEADGQNLFLRMHMDLRARTNVPETTGSGRPPRRITCKYLVPILNEGRTVEVCQKAFVSAFVITTKRVRLQREKLIASLGLNSYRSHNRSKKEKDDKSIAMMAKAAAAASDTSIDNNNDSLTLNNNTITLNTLKSKFHLPSNLSVIMPRCLFYEMSRFIYPTKRPLFLFFKSTFDQNPRSMPPTITTNNNNNNNVTNYGHSKSVLESNSAKKLASILGKKSLEELKELNISLEKDSSTDSDRDDGFLRAPPLKKARFVKRQRNNNMMDNPLIPFGLIVPDGVTIAPVFGPENDNAMAIVNNFFNNQLWKPEYIGAYS
ncbi:uncharacterized protein LOC115882847 [Sitophilus oryzae]|uniref:Uncharacterized protein LOC115882847 n=1 Tax=Sitophilus oryzae TaxID=7048 RepID=A0A6J2Y0X8_SITOR|nr:uncharacterized protein LOC115882847 [Sitophilus oryzae]